LSGRTGRAPRSRRAAARADAKLATSKGRVEVVPRPAFVETRYPGWILIGAGVRREARGGLGCELVRFGVNAQTNGGGSAWARSPRPMARRSSSRTGARA